MDEVAVAEARVTAANPAARTSHCNSRATPRAVLDEATNPIPIDYHYKPIRHEKEDYQMPFSARFVA